MKWLNKRWLSLHHHHHHHVTQTNQTDLPYCGRRYVYTNKINSVRARDQLAVAARRQVTSRKLTKPTAVRYRQPIRLMGHSPDRSLIPRYSCFADERQLDSKLAKMLATCSQTVYQPGVHRVRRYHYTPSI